MNIYTSFLKKSPQNIDLTPHQIDIWQFSLTRNLTASETMLLSEDERVRAKRYYFERHQRRFSVARATLRQILSMYLQEPAEKLQFDYQQQGKPYVKNSPIEFNISHSGELALLAVGCNHALGVDLELFSARPYEGIGKHLFSSHENEALAQLRTALQPLGFFHIWSQKEAFIKATGLGLSYPTTNITMPILPPERYHFIDPIASTSWQMMSFLPTLSCCAALCYHPDIQNIRYIAL